MTQYERIKGLELPELAREMNVYEACLYCQWNDKDGYCSALRAGINVGKCCVEATEAYLRSEVRKGE